MKKGTLTRWIGIAAAVAALALAFAPFAAAAGSGKNSILSTYGGSARPIVSITKPQHGSLGAGSGTGLPNTGLDVAIVVAGGLGVAALGLGLRRLGRRRA